MLSKNKMLYDVNLVNVVGATLLRPFYFLEPIAIPPNFATSFHSLLGTHALGTSFMRVILQRVQRGSVTVEGRVTGAVENGFVALVGVTHGDTAGARRNCSRAKRPICASLRTIRAR